MAQRPQMGRPPGATSEATTARILAAARVCFARTGYAATTNKQIADEAGVTAAAIYLYFESKTALYVAAGPGAHPRPGRAVPAGRPGARGAGGAGEGGPRAGGAAAARGAAGRPP